MTWLLLRGLWHQLSRAGLSFADHHGIPIKDNDQASVFNETKLPIAERTSWFSVSLKFKERSTPMRFLDEGDGFFSLFLPVLLRVLLSLFIGLDDKPTVPIGSEVENDCRKQPENETAQAINDRREDYRLNDLREIR